MSAMPSPAHPCLGCNRQRNDVRCAPMSYLVRLSPAAVAVFVFAVFGDAVSGARAAERPAPLVETICPLMEREARLNGLPPSLFVRLIWRESAFRPNTVSHKGAQGIAQFMPGTARERGLADPFDPGQAIPHSARLLADLTREFGNFGLAAAAYNAGPDRVRGWLDSKRTLPAETRAYVLFITGQAAERWKDVGAASASMDDPNSDVLQRSCKGRAPALMQVALPAPAKPPVASGKSSAWGVQLAVNFSQSKVADMFDGLKRRHPALLIDARPMFVAARNLSRGRRAMTAVRVGAETREAALSLCQRLRAGGGVCTVEKN